ncbi:DnaB-like replicative helicase [Mycobacterium phage DroogsArmy]|uniref:DnaB-like dsDNA helicase n=1 Tax=Mycobacterium phage DroogsArmy TaxID=2744011 RepID=A0A6N0A727_9CAUD|nr:DnaB-like replicative helicase [Mycobacterium phage DroogsArmy]QKO02459.1 DnaB-like dsDNA helicase [Mycobacterium phage DroogsArmy]
MVGACLMYTPLQSIRVKGSAGDPLPTVFPSLSRKGTKFLRGQLALIAAGPGTGKSAFVLAYTLQARVPTLYFSADSDAFTQLSRMIAMEKGWSLEKAANLVRSDDLTEVSDAFEEVPIRFNYNASPSLGQIEDSMSAYFQLAGDYPSLVVIDNITNVRGTGEDDDPFAGLESMMDYLHTMARNTGACVVGLHHVTGTYNDADKPIPLSGVKGQITRVPELVLTLHRVKDEFGPEVLNVSTVKNRAGQMDPSGNSFVSLEFTGDTMQIRDNT